MSRSNPKQENPAKKFIQWSGSEGEFYYYDKERQENVRLEMPIYFMFLDELSCVKGYSEEYKQGIFSNEVRNTLNDKLNVRVFNKGTIKVGLWQDIKSKVKEQGGKYCKSVYALMLKPDQTTELVNFQFFGSSFGGCDDGGGWINVKWDKEKGGIQVKEAIKGKNGGVNYLSPVFERVNVNKDHDLLAVEADRKLQEYLNAYLQKGGEIEEKIEEIVEGQIENKDQYEMLEGDKHQDYVNDSNPMPRKEDFPFF